MVLLDEHNVGRAHHLLDASTQERPVVLDGDGLGGVLSKCSDGLAVPITNVLQELLLSARFRLSQTGVISQKPFTRKEGSFLACSFFHGTLLVLPGGF